MTQRTFVTRQMSETVTRDAWPGDSLCNQCTACEEYSLLASLMILPIVRGFSWKSRPLPLFYPLLPTPWLPPCFPLVSRFLRFLSRTSEKCSLLGLNADCPVLRSTNRLRATGSFLAIVYPRDYAKYESNYISTNIKRY